MSDIEKYSEKCLDDNAYDYKTTTSNFRNRKLWMCKEYYREDYDGYVIIKFKVGITNHIWWSKSFSNIWSNIIQTANDINQSEKLQIKYFDKKSGKLITFDELVVIKLEKEAKDLLQENKLADSKLRLEDALHKSKIIYERIRNSLDSIKLALEAVSLQEQHEYEKAYTLFQDAYNKSTEIEFYNKFKQLRDSIEHKADKQKEEREFKAKQEMKRIELNNLAERLFNKGLEYYNMGDYNKAVDKFQEAYLKSTSGSANEYKYLWWKAECLQKLNKYTEALKEYNNALLVINDPQKKMDCTKQRNDCAKKQIKKEKKQKLILLEDEGYQLLKERKFSEAELKFKQVVEETKDQKIKEKLTNLSELIKLGSEALKLARALKYEEAYLKLEEVYFKSNDLKLNKIFLNEMDVLKPFAEEQRCKRELREYVIYLEQEAINLANQTKFSESLVKLNEALSKSSDLEIKLKIKNSIDSIRLGLEGTDYAYDNKFNLAFVRYHDAFNLAQDLILKNKFLVLMNSIKLKRSQNAQKLFEKGKYYFKLNKFSEASEYFEKAKIEIGLDDLELFNEYSMWKADSLNKNHSYTEAINEYNDIIVNCLDESVKTICRTKRDDCSRKQEVKKLFEKGQDLNLSSKHLEAIELFDKCNGKLDDKYMYLISWWKADSLTKLNRFEDALQEYDSVLNKIENLSEKTNCLKQREECKKRIDKNKKHFKDGLLMWNRSWLDENLETNKYLSDAKIKFENEFGEEAISYKTAIGLRLDGVTCMNEGIVWKKLADKMLDESNYESKENYLTSLESFNKAKSKFIDGLKYDIRFEKCIKIIEDLIDDVKAKLVKIDDFFVEIKITNLAKESDQNDDGNSLIIKFSN